MISSYLLFHKKRTEDEIDLEAHEKWKKKKGMEENIIQTY